MTTRRCRLYIDEYMEAIESGEIPASRRLRKAMPYIRSKLDAPGVYIDEEKAKKAVELIEKYFEIKLVPWELFIIALVHAYHEDGTLVFTEDVGRRLWPLGWKPSRCKSLTMPTTLTNERRSLSLTGSGRRPSRRRWPRTYSPVPLNQKNDWKRSVARTTS